MHTGIFSNVFPPEGFDRIFRRVKELGYETVQVNFSSAGIPSLPEILPRTVVESAFFARHRHNLRIESLSATYNMVHPDPSVRDHGLTALAMLASCAGPLGCRLLTLCTGTLDPDDQWRRHPGNDSPAAWRTLLSSMEEAVRIAEDLDVDLGIEPELGNVVNSAAKAAELIRSLGSPRLRVVFDPANLFERTETPEEQRDLIRASLDQVREHVVQVHAKDRAPDGSFTSAGRGVLDYPFFIRLLADAGYFGGVVAHSLPVEEAAFVSDMLGRLIAENAS